VTVRAGPTPPVVSSHQQTAGNFVCKGVLHPYKSIPGIPMQKKKHGESEQTVPFASNNGASERGCSSSYHLPSSWLRARRGAAEEDERRKQGRRRAREGRRSRTSFLLVLLLHGYRDCVVQLLFWTVDSLRAPITSCRSLGQCPLLRTSPCS
jgi:hypothetical protein